MRQPDVPRKLRPIGFATDAIEGNLLRKVKGKGPTGMEGTDLLVSVPGRRK